MNKLGPGRSVFYWVSILACLVGMVSRQSDATPVSASVSPASTTVSPGGSRRFTAAISGMNTARSWKTGSGRGSMSTTGLYTTFTHCHGDDPRYQHGGYNKSASATVSVTAPIVLRCRCYPIQLWERLGL